MINLAQVRADTPACERLIHFNNAGCALSPSPVAAAVIEHLELAQEIGGYEAAQQAEGAINNFYTQLGLLLHCTETEVAFMESATRAWQFALLSIELKAGEQVITADNEYASNYLSLLHLAQHRDIEVITVESGADGLINPQHIKDNITNKTRAIAITHVASQRGDIQTLTEIGEIARAHGLTYLVDACQSIGQVDVNLQQLNCDFLCGTGRKYLRGPRGTGFLYANQETTEGLLPPVADLQAASWESASRLQLRPDALRFESWERNIAGMIGLGKAVEYANALGMEAIQARVGQLAGLLHQKLRELPGVEVHERSTRLSGIVTLSKQDVEAAMLRQFLQENGINSSIARKTNARLDLEPVLQRDVLRVSLHYYNSEEEIDRFVDLLAQQ